MKKLTNRLNLPEPFVLAVSQKTYDNQGSWRSVTELIAPPKIAHLKRLHEDDIVEDVADRVYTLQGEIAHGVVERAAKEMSKEGWKSEERIFKEILGKKVSGAFDLFHPGRKELIDVKNSTAWKAKKGEAPEEWVNQINALAVLLRGERFEVERASIVLIIRDHSKLEAKRNDDYPKDPVMLLSVPLWSPERAADYLVGRVRLHIEAETKEAMCSAEERWAKPDIWAIRKRGTQRAINGGLYAVEEAAVMALRALGPTYEIEHRKGENTRCENYCAAAPFCNQFKNLTRKP